jgi:hypothetical protein
MGSSLPQNTPGLTPKEALTVSSDRLAKLRMLAGWKQLSPGRREVISNLVRVQAAIVEWRRRYLKSLN